MQIDDTPEDNNCDNNNNNNNKTKHTNITTTTTNKHTHKQNNNNKQTNNPLQKKTPPAHTHRKQTNKQQQQQRTQNKTEIITMLQENAGENGVKIETNDIKGLCLTQSIIRVQELCESRSGRPGLHVLMSLTVSVDVKQHWTMLRHWSQFVPNMSTDIRGHEAPHHHHHQSIQT